ncbi:PTS transporter subunit IIC [Haloarchaeobius amylolyticus]|uniref:PTS transporter subunit IIC n=1 Tax=Haloarchaeobius amylolyticus TaxID=1198296 RepID=UPI00226F80A6|nr:PTS transporter subunit IIC [Haloarchaeobius amylolyticus]
MMPLPLEPRLQVAAGAQSLAQVQELLAAMGPALLMPIIVFLLGVAVGLPLLEAARSGLLVGVAFVGIFALLDFVLGPISVTIQALATVWGLNLVGLDIGWAPVSGFAWAMGVTALVIPLGLGVNLALLAVGWTRTLDADIWNYWQWALNAAIVYVVTGSWVLGLAAAIVTEVIVLRLADWTAELGQAYFEIPGTSLPHAQSVLQAPFAFAIDRCLRSVPVVGSVEVSPEAIERRIGVFGEPVILGFLVGLFVGVLAQRPPLESFRTGVYVAGLLTLLPEIVGFLVDGLDPVVDRASTRIDESDRFGGETVVIGIDAGAIVFADTTSVVAGLLLIPYALGLAVIPGIVVMPLADLVVLPIFCMWAAAISRGNLVRTVIGGAMMTTVVTVASTLLAPYITAMGRSTGGLQTIDTNGAELVSALSAGGHWWSLGLFAPLGLGKEIETTVVVAGLLSAVLAYGCYRWTREMPARVAAACETETTEAVDRTPKTPAVETDD